MSIFIGTQGGLFRAPESKFETAELALDCGFTHRLRTFPDEDGLFATSDTGLYRTTDGIIWERVTTPRKSVWDVLITAEEMYIGTSPAEVYRSIDGGGTWDECESLQNVPRRDLWRSAPKPLARTRSIQRGAGESDTIFAGIEAGGLFVSDDKGVTWTELDVRGHTDIHQIVPIAPREFLVVCGRLSITDLNHAADLGGIFHTDDGGASFNRISDAIGPDYVREVLLRDGVLYVGSSYTIPPVWINGGSGEGHLFESSDLIHFEEATYPGGPEEFIQAWGVCDGVPIAGTAAGAIRDEPSGRVIRKGEAGEWESLGTVPSYIHALTTF